MMTRIVAGLGVAVGVAGLWLLLFPDQLISVMDWESRQGLYVAASIRIVTGLVLILGAPGSRYPKGLKIFGGLVFAAGLGILLVPLDAWAGLIHWFFTGHPAFVRLGGGIGGALLGGFLFHAGRPEAGVSP